MKLFDRIFSKKSEEIIKSTDTFVPLNFHTVNGYGSFNPIYQKLNNHVLIDIFNTVPDVFGIIDTIGDLASNIPLIAKKGEKQVDLNELQSLLQPNPYQNTYKQFSYLNFVYYLVLGGSYVNKLLPEILDGKGELYTLFAQDVEIIPEYDINSVDYRRNKIKSYRVNNGVQFDILPENIIHFKSNNINYNSGAYNYFYGYPKLGAALMACTSLQEVYNVIVAMYQQRGAIGVMSTDNVDLPIQDPKELQDQYFKKYGLHAGKYSLLITNSSVKYQQIAMDFDKLLTGENKRANIESIANVMNYPLPLIFNDAATYNNRDIARTDLYTGAVIPLVNNWCSTLTKGLNLDKKGIQLHPDTSNIEELKESKEQKAKIYGMFFETGLITQNEAREAIGYTKTSDGNKFIFDYQKPQQNAI